MTAREQIEKALLETKFTGRKVQFRNKYGIDVIGTVIRTSYRYGSMELNIDGKTEVIGYPFKNPSTRFID